VKVRTNSEFAASSPKSGTLRWLDDFRTLCLLDVVYGLKLGSEVTSVLFDLSFFFICCSLPLLFTFSLSSADIFDLSVLICILLFSLRL
jgi:hypothetical protein